MVHRPTTGDGYEYAGAGVLRRAIRQAVTRRPIAALSARFLPGLDRFSYRVTGGRLVLSAWLTGLPVIELVTTGARTGAERRTRVLGVPEPGGRLLVIAANFGRSVNPAWYHNVRTHPHVLVISEGVARDFIAHDLTGRDRDRGFDRAVTMNPGWRRFAATAGTRTIPVIRLDPAGGPGHVTIGAHS